MNGNRIETGIGGTMTDKRFNFVCKLFNDYNFKGTQWEVDTQMDNYYNFIVGKEQEIGKEFDYDKVVKLLSTEYKKKTIPTKFELGEYLKRAIIKNYDDSKSGQLLVFICYCLDANNNPVFRQVYDFTIDNNTDNGKSASSYEYQLKERYEIVKSKFYPAGSTLTGSWKRGFKVYYPPTQTEIRSEIVVTEEECILAKEFELARAS